VIETSHRQPVLVAFSAPWSGPARLLLPVLERIVGETGERVKLVELSAPGAVDLASRLEVRALPDVRAFRNGALAARFVGNLPEREIRLALDPVLPTPASERARQGLEEFAAGRNAAAVAHYRAALDHDPRFPPALLGLGRALAAGGDMVRAREVLWRVPKLSPQRAVAAAEIAAIDIGEDLATRVARESRRRLEADPSDRAASYDLALALAGVGRDEEARAALAALGDGGDTGSDLARSVRALRQRLIDRAGPGSARAAGPPPASGTD
jgi:putative thioredoxin